MDELYVKLNNLRENCMNINTIDDIDFLENSFCEINKCILTKDTLNLVSECLLFIIEQVTSREDLRISKVNDLKIETIKRIIQERVIDILDPVYYYYYLSIREYLVMYRHDIVSLLENLYLEDIFFLNPLQKKSLLVQLDSVKSRLDDVTLVNDVIEKIEKIDVSITQEFEPSKIKQLEEQNKILQEEIANLNYIMMMNNML